MPLLPSLLASPASIGAGPYIGTGSPDEPLDDVVDDPPLDDVDDVDDPPDDAELEAEVEDELELSSFPPQAAIAAAPANSSAVRVITRAVGRAAATPSPSSAEQKGHALSLTRT